MSMNAPGRRILLLSLGNDILGDDGIGLEAARILRKLCEDGVDVVEAVGDAQSPLRCGLERPSQVERCAPRVVAAEPVALRQAPGRQFDVGAEVALGRIDEHRSAGADHVCIQVLTESDQEFPLRESREIATALPRA